MIRAAILALVLLASLGPASAIIVPSAGKPSVPLYVTGSSVGNGADLTEDTLQTYTLPGGTLINVGDRLHVVAGGAYAASTDSKSARVKIGATQLATPSGTTVNTTTWQVDAWVVKTGNNAQSYNASAVVVNTSSAGGRSGTATLTDTGALNIVVTGQNTTASTANSITCQYFAVDYYPAP